MRGELGNPTDPMETAERMVCYHRMDLWVNETHWGLQMEPVHGWWPPTLPPFLFRSSWTPSTTPPGSFALRCRTRVLGSSPTPQSCFRSLCSARGVVTSYLFNLSVCSSTLTQRGLPVSLMYSSTHSAQVMTYTVPNTSHSPSLPYGQTMEDGHVEGLS